MTRLSRRRRKRTKGKSSHRRSHRRSHKHSPGCTHRQRSQRRQRRSQRKRGGGHLTGAPVGYQDDWSSKMSQGQGQDYFKYHQGQHGGEAGVNEWDKPFLEGSMGAASMTGSIDRALSEIQGMRDQAGGRRRSKRRRHRRKRGGALSFAPLSSNPMLLSQSGYDRAGLSPEWGGNVEFTSAAIRNSM